MKKELQNKDKGLGFLRHWKVMTMTLLLLTFSIGNVWGQTFRYYIAISNNDATSVSSGKLQVFKTSDDEHFENVTSQFTLNSNYSTSSAPSNLFYNSSYAFSNSSTNAILKGVRYTKNKTFTINWTKSILSFNKITFQGFGTSSKDEDLTVKNSSSDAGETVTLAKGTTITPYEVTKNFTQENGITIVSANTDNAYAITILHAVDHAEITSTATEMVTSESLQMEGWPSGGTWSIAEGGTGTGSITSAGVLTASANGTIKVKYAKEGYGEDIKTITVSDSRSVYWFAAGDTDAETNSVSNNTSFFTFTTTSTSGQSGNITIGETEFSLTKRLNTEKNLFTFDIPENTKGTLHIVAISSGSNRTLFIKESGDESATEIGATTNTSSSWSLISKVDIAAGSYAVTADNNARLGMLYMIISKTTPAVVGDYTVTAATSTGDNSRGTVSAGASSLDATKTTTITASPAAGYQVTNWAVADEDHGASIDPAGESNSNTTTLTMGTANATVTVTFGLIDYTVSKTLTNCAVKDGSTAIPATMNYGDDLSTIIEPTSGNLLPWSITVTGVTSYTWNASTGALTLTDVTGDVSISIEAAAPQTGSGTITYALVTSGETAATYSAGAFTGILSRGTPSLNTLGASNTLTGGNGVDVQSDKNTPKSSRTAGVTSSTADFNAASSPYVEFTFSVLDGYTFTPTAISVPVLAISNNAYFTAIVTDGNSTWTSATAECTQGAQAYINAAPADGSALTGTVNIRVYCHNQATAAKGFRFGTGNVTITGTVIVAGACTPPTIAWDGDQPADAFVSDGSKTFKVTSNYTDGIDLELSPNTCGATVAAKAGSGNKQWVVSFTGAGSVTITPKVVGDGSTVCAETVSAAAKTLTVTLAHDVTFNMNGHGAAIAKQVVADGGKATAPFVADVDGWVFGGWYTDAGCTVGNEFSFSTTISADLPLYAKWTEDACSDRRSIFKAVLSGDETATVTGENSKEYAGDVLLNKLGGSDGNRNTNATIEGIGSGLTTYKMNGTGAYMYGVLKKGAFQEGDKVSFAVSYTPNTLAIYGAKSSDLSQRVLIINMPAPNAAKVFTYRLTAADADALEGYDAIGIYRASDVTMNPYLYSLEITGCRSWAVTHNVTFDMKDHGTQVAPQVIAEGDNLTKPNVVEPEGWAFVGWYKETTLENEWNFATDVMGTEDITLYAKWESEAGVIKLFNNTGDLNTTNFVSAAKADDPIEIESVDYPCLADFGSNRTSLAGTTQADVVQYNATTDAAKIKLDLYNTNGSAKSAYLWMVEEGAETATPIEIEVPGNTRVTTSYYAFNSTKNRSFYVTSGAKSNIKVLQVKVLDNGNAIQQFGKAGYSVNLNKGRIIAAANATIPFEGATIHSNEAYTVLNSSNLKPKTYIQFNNAVANTTVKITKASSNKYYVTNDLDNKGDEYSTDQEIVLTTTGTWYIGSVNSSSVAALSKIEFVAPKCEKPTITTQPATNVTFGAGNLTATVVAEVSDGGTLSYQWYNASDDSEVTGADEATLTTTTEGTYYVIVTNTLAAHQNNSTKSEEATLGYRTLNDATLSALSYGTPATAIALEADKYTYRIILDEGTTDVPELHATATMEAYGATADVTDATVFTDYRATSTVLVRAEDGTTTQTYTVTFVVQHIYTVMEDVTESTTWNWTGVEASDVDINDVANRGVILGNYIGGSNFEMMEGKAGEKAFRDQNGGVYQGTYLHFNTTVPGRVKFYFRAPSGGENCTITVKNGGRTVVAGTRPNSFGWSDEVFVNGDVVVEMVNDKEGGGTTRVQQVVFTTADPNYTRPVTEGRFGTICLPNGGVMVGAALFEVAYHDATLEKIFFDEILNGEMVAGRPYIFLPNDGVSALGVFYTDAANAPAGNYHGLYGSYTQEVLAQEAGNYILYNNQYMYVGASSSNVSVGANRAYFKIGVEGGIPTNAVAPLPGRRRVSMSAVRETPTGLENGELINGENGVQKVLINGELFILRGEKMYDATGRLVK